MKWIRCLGAATLIAVVILAIPGARPALAAAPSVSIDSPVADTTALTPFAISGSTSQGGTDAVIVSVKVKLTDDDAWLPPVEHNYANGGTSNSAIFSGSGAAVNFNWTNISPKYNGPYTVTVTAVGQYRPPLSAPTQQTTNVSKSFHVKINPATPTGVTATKSDASDVVSVKWKANPEPDIALYQVYRSYAGDSGKPLGDPIDGKTLTLTDDLTGKAPGQYKYAVQAIRHARSCKSTSNTDAECTAGVPGNKSAFGAPVTVHATAPTTTTTTIKKPTGGGSTGGGSTGGGSTGGGSTGGGSTGGGSTGGGSSNAAGIRRGTGGGGFAPGGEVDLSKFGSLLNPKERASGSGRVGDADGPYDPSLPYGERAAEAPKDDDSLITIGGASLPRPSDDWVKFIGAGSLATALLVHVLWFKQQVDSIPLETLSE